MNFYLQTNDIVMNGEREREREREVMREDEEEERLLVPGAFYRTIGLVYKNQIHLLSTTDSPCKKDPYELVVLNPFVGYILYYFYRMMKQWFLSSIRIHPNTECIDYFQSVRLKHDSVDLIAGNE